VSDQLGSPDLSEAGDDDDSHVGRRDEPDEPTPEEELPVGNDDKKEDEARDDRGHLDDSPENPRHDETPRTDGSPVEDCGHAHHWTYVVAMMVDRLEDGAHERVALVFMTAEEWGQGMLVSERAELRLV